MSYFADHYAYNFTTEGRLDAHTIKAYKVSAYADRFYLTWWWLADQLFLITDNYCGITVRPPKEAHGAESGITYKHMCQWKPVYGHQLIPLYERLSHPDLLELLQRPAH